MGTRSRIGVMHGDKCKSVYCHWDGYLEHNGAILQKHYNSAKANQLVALGDLSVLAPELIPTQEHSFEQPQKGVTVFYGRDRGEKNTDFRVADSFDEFLRQCENCTAEYYYLNKDGVWYVGDTYGVTPLSGKLVALVEALAEVAVL